MYDDGAEALCIDLPVHIKARTDGDRRLVEVEASNEEKDGEKDIIKQAALLDDAASFVSTDHLDIDHYSEIGERLGITNPTDYIVGAVTGRGRKRPVRFAGEAGRSGCKLKSGRSDRNRPSPSVSINVSNRLADRAKLDQS
jgi:hypothetical protein